MLTASASGGTPPFTPHSPQQSQQRILGIKTALLKHPEFKGAAHRLDEELHGLRERQGEGQRASSEGMGMESLEGQANEPVVPQSARVNEDPVRLSFRFIHSIKCIPTNAFNLVHSI